MFFRIILALSFPLSLCACATHPLPEDYARVDTFSIVKRIRCEARSAIKDATAEFLKKFDPNDRYAIDSGAALASGTMDFAELDVARLGPNTKPYIVKYEPAAIAYDFTFDITEENNISTQVDLGGIISRGAFLMPIKAENDRQRQTVRNFRIADKFGNLRGDSTLCVTPQQLANHAYPITGRIGLAEVVRTFIDLNENQHLTGSKDAETVPTLADTFNFQTTISGSLAPKITLSPLRGAIDVADAEVAGAASRKDIHRVIVAMALPTESPHHERSKSGPGGRKMLGILPGLQKEVPGSADDHSAKKRALDELDFQIQKNILNNLLVRPNS